MTYSADNISTPSIITPDWLGKALDAGLDMTLRSLAPLGLDEKTLAIQLGEAVHPHNPELAASIRLDTLQLLASYMEQQGTLVQPNNAAWPLDADGPASITPVYYQSTQTLVIWHDKTGMDDYTGYMVSIDEVVIAAGDLPETGDIQIVEDLSAWPDGTISLRLTMTDEPGQGWYTRATSATVQVQA